MSALSQIPVFGYGDFDHTRQELRFDFHVDGYSDSDVKAAAIAYCGSDYPDLKWPHATAYFGIVEVISGDPGTYVKYHYYDVDGNFTGRIMEWTPL